jgi:flagellar FliJ protein
MAKFEFQFEAVLHHRKVQEDQKQRTLAKLLREKLILENQLRSMQQTISTDKREMAGSLVGSVDVRRIRQHAAHAGQVAVLARHMAARLMIVHKQIDLARAELLKAAKAKKAIELLREKQFTRWRKAEDKKDAAMLDEIATQAYARRSEVLR